MPKTKTTINEAVLMTLRHFAEHGGFKFTTYYVGVGLLEAKIDHTWDILSVTVNDKAFSFTACQRGQKPVEYSNRTPESLEKIKKWFEETTETISSFKEGAKSKGITAPSKFVFALKIRENFE